MTTGAGDAAITTMQQENQPGIWPAVAAGLLTAFVGYASSFTVVLQGLKSVGATPGQATSGLIAVGTAMGLCAVILALRNRMPISIAWSTPGAALLISTGAVAGGFEAACGAFIVSGILIIIAGLWKPFGTLIASIPPVLANAMLAGVLFTICVAPFHAIAEMPKLALPVVIAWALVARWKRLYAMPVAVAVTVIALVVAASSFSAMCSRWRCTLTRRPSFAEFERSAINHLKIGPKASAYSDNMDATPR